MARQWTEGAEAGDVLFWDLAPGSVANSTSGRINGRCFTVATGANRRSVSSCSEFYWRFAILRTATNVTLGWQNGTTELGSLRYNSTSQSIDIYVGGSLQASGTKQIAASTWYCIEVHVKIADAGGIIEYKVDGVLQSASFSGDTKPAALSTIDNISWTVASGSCSLDDMAFNDVSGIVDNSWPGDAHIYRLSPSGDGDLSQFIGSDGNSTSNYLLVDDAQSNSDTDYVESATTGNKDLYQLEDLPTLPTGTTIKRVVIETRAKEVTAAGDAINLGVKSGPTESWSSNIVVGTSYQRQVAEFPTDPDTSVDWTESGINAMQVGVKVA